MIDRILALPWGWAFLFLWVSVMGRANGTYWIGRETASHTEPPRGRPAPAVPGGPGC